MEEQSEIVRSKKEFAFASSTILSQVGRGIIVGLIVGIIVGSFRFLIEKGFHLIQGVYQDQGYLVRNLFVLVLFYILICWLSAKLTRSEKDIKGSGIPQVEAELKGLMSLNWWGILHSLEKICARYSCYCQWTHAGSRGTQYSTWSSWW